MRTVEAFVLQKSNSRLVPFASSIRRIGYVRGFGLMKYRNDFFDVFSFDASDFLLFQSFVRSWREAGLTQPHSTKFMFGEFTIYILA